jgi:dienelactone hydrolase
MARKTLGAPTMAAWSMFRQASNKAVEDLDSAIAYGRKLAGVRSGPVLLAGQSRGGFLAMRYAGLKPGEVMGVVNFSGGWYPYRPVTTPYYANAGRGAAENVPQLWLMPTTTNSTPKL